jgi:DNA helicase HerA-like ATPase
VTYNKKVPIGWLDYENKDDTELYYIDFKTSHRILVLGGSGFGKSWNVRALFNRAYLGGVIPIILTDVAPEYFSSVKPLQPEYTKFLLGFESPITLPVKVYTPYFLYRFTGFELPDQIFFQMGLSEINPSDITAFVDYNEMGFSSKQEIQNIIAQLLKSRNKLKTVDDLLAFIEHRELNQQTKNALLKAFDNLKNLGVFGDDYPNIELIKNIKENVISDINLFGWNGSDINRYVSIYMTILIREIINAKNLGKIDVDTSLLVVLEELHKFAPKSKSTSSQDILRKGIASAAKEGRKFGVSFAFATQSPDDIDQSIIDQCDYVFVPVGFNPKKVMALTKDFAPSEFNSQYEFYQKIMKLMGVLKKHRDGARDWLIIKRGGEITKCTPIAPLTFHRSEGDPI